MTDDLLTIEQAAQLLKVSKDTIRRRIKANEVQAEKHPGPYGDQWLLPSFQFEQAAMIQDVIPMTRQVSVAELQQAMQRGIADAVAHAMKAETAELKEKLSILEEKLDATNNILDGHYRLVDERLRQVMENNQKRSLWSKLFG